MLWRSKSIRKGFTIIIPLLDCFLQYIERQLEQITEVIMPTEGEVQIESRKLSNRFRSLWRRGEKY